MLNSRVVFIPFKPISITFPPEKRGGDPSDPTPIYGHGSIALLPTGSEEREVLSVGSIAAAILPSSQKNENYEYEYSWAVKIRNTSEAVLGSKYSPWLSY